MQDKTVFTATEARQNFFELLRLVDSGKDHIIKKEDSNKQYRMIEVKEKKPIDKMKVLKEMAQINLHIGSWEKAKKIINTMHDVKV